MDSNTLTSKKIGLEIISQKCDFWGTLYEENSHRENFTKNLLIYALSKMKHVVIPGHFKAWNQEINKISAFFV